MPQLPAIDEFPYIAQDEDSLACVPVCVGMVCEVLGLPREQDELEVELGYFVDSGTPFENVGLIAGLRAWPVADVTEIAAEIERGLPIIANLRIDNDGVLGYAADGPFLHAVVVVGIDQEGVLFFDPLSQIQLSTTSPTVCERIDFERAWRGGWVLSAL